MLRAMRDYRTRLGWTRAALAATLMLCLVFQVFFAGLLSGQATAVSNDVLAALESSICSSSPGLASAEHPTNQSPHQENACFLHCLGAVGSGTPVAYVAVLAPANVVLTEVGGDSGQQSWSVAKIRSGLGARAPPVLIA